MPYTSPYDDYKRSVSELNRGGVSVFDPKGQGFASPTYDYGRGAQGYSSASGREPVNTARTGMGLSSLRNLSPDWFNPTSYLRANPDVANAGIDAWRHYMAFGKGEGRLLAPRASARPRAQSSQNQMPGWFNPSAYLRANTDVAKAGVDAWQHYINFGKREGRRLEPGARRGLAGTIGGLATEFLKYGWNNLTYTGNSEDPEPAAWHPSQGGVSSIFRPRRHEVLESAVGGRKALAGRLAKFGKKHGARFDNFWPDMKAVLFTDDVTNSSIIVKYGDIKTLPKKLSRMRKEFAAK